MKECKDSGILPCYRDGYGVWHHLDDTHDKVYELNMQMCDIESGLSNDLLGVQMLIADKLAKDVVKGARTPDWAKNMLAGIPEHLSRAKYEILDEILKEKNRFMEEKKTRKMTKAEAFEWLKCKKVYVSCREISEKVQLKLFACGVQWMSGGTDVCDYDDYYVINSHGRLGYCDGGSFWENLINEEISADDILSIEIVEEKKCSEEDGFDLISTVGARLSEVLRRMEGHKHIVITETDVILYDEGMSLFHSDPF